MSFSDLDRQRMREALALAAGVIGLTDPNPRVGCLIVDESTGRVLGSGATQRAGEAHAEVMALRAARDAGLDTRGATAWVTLEPCAHHGRTPPCCDALVEAGIRRVVIAAIDPFPQVAGAGAARLRASGVEVVMADEALAAEARELNLGFFSRVERQRPWVRLKVACTLDGRTALPNGVSQWITDETSRADVQHWRLRAGAVLTGIGTVDADNPRMDVRLPQAQRQPLRVVLDSSFSLSPLAAITRPPGTLLVCGCHDAPERRATLHAAGVRTALLPTADDGRPALAPLLTLLARQEAVNELHVEAGARLNGAFLRSGLVDELLVYMAPRLFGAGRAMAELGVLEHVDQSPRFSVVAVDPLGVDLRIRLRPVDRGVGGAYNSPPMGPA